jgi:hypothetical protein
MTRTVILIACFMTAFVTVVLLGRGYVPDTAPEPVPDPVTPTKTIIENDLQIRAVFPGPGTITAGIKPWIVAELVNRSKVNGFWVVRPGDGSECGWREPYVYCTVRHQVGNHDPIELKPEQYSRCGNFDGGWVRDTVLLKPGNSLPLNLVNWFDYQQAGRYRLQVHYEYGAGDGKKSRTRFSGDPKLVLGVLADIPRFEIVSNVVEFDVVRPLDVRVKVKRTLKVGVRAKLSDFIDVSLVNQSNDVIECTSPTVSADARLNLEKEFVPDRNWTQDIQWQEPVQKTTYGTKCQLNPGESVPLIGSHPFANGRDNELKCMAEGTFRFRANYHTSTWKSSGEPVIKSDWFEIKVEK